MLSSGKCTSPMNDLTGRLTGASLFALFLAGCSSSNGALPPRQNPLLPMSIRNGTNSKLTIVPGRNQCMLRTPPRTTLRPNKQWSGQIELKSTCNSNHWFFDLFISDGFEAAGGTWTKTGAQDWKVILLSHGLALKCRRAPDCIFHVTIVKHLGLLPAIESHSLETKFQRSVT